MFLLFDSAVFWVFVVFRKFMRSVSVSDLFFSWLDAARFWSFWSLFGKFELYPPILISDVYFTLAQLGFSLDTLSVLSSIEGELVAFLLDLCACFRSILLLVFGQNACMFQNGLTPMHLCAQEDRVGVATAWCVMGPKWTLKRRRAIRPCT